MMGNILKNEAERIKMNIINGVEKLTRFILHICSPENKTNTMILYANVLFEHE